MTHWSSGPRGYEPFLFFEMGKYHGLCITAVNMVGVELHVLANATKSLN
jgi:hypothetical protein